ncbi:polyketide synthase module [Streptomyces sp. SPB074]|nr:polyketide synthase module [Streptomyces sp. SPB074]
MALRPLPTADQTREEEPGQPRTVVLVPRLGEAAPPDPSVASDEGTTWVFHTAAARPLAEALARTGGTTRIALPADGTPPAVPEETPDTVYWLATHDPAAPLPGPGADPATLGLFRLLRTLLGRGAGSRALTLKVALSGAVSEGERGPAQPHSAGLIGLTRSAAAEYPKWRAGCVDLPPEGTSPEEYARLLRAEPCAEPLVVLRGGRRLVRGLAPAPAPHPAGTDHAPGFRENGAYVVIGGTGGIGSALARHLARTHRARLVLVGRRAQDASIQALLDELGALGGRASYVRGDLADPAAARRIVTEARERTGRVDGVFHSALVLRDSTLAAMDEDTFLDVLAPKTSGLVALAAALEEEPPDFLVCFSSAISFTDAPGQANYAAASTFEDAFAGHLRARSFPATVLNWGFWGSVGVVAQERRVERFAELGIGSLEPAEGIAALTRVIEAGHPQAVVVKGTPRGLALLGADAGDTADPLSGARAGFAELERLAAHLSRARLLATDGTGSTALTRWDGAHPEGSPGARLVRALEDLLERAGRESAPVDGLLDRHPAMRPHVTLLRRCVDALPDVLDGSRPATDVLFPGGRVDLVESVYRGQPLSDHHHRLMAAETVAALRRHRAAGRPLRVLEIGAGTGAGTAFVLDALDEALAAGDAPAVSYTYTDVSPAFLAHGEREFGPGRAYLSFRVLDIERPPTAEDRPPQGYDLVLATNVLHATADIARTLEHVRALLAPGGVLLVNEVTRASDFLTLTFGLTPGWWAFRDAERRLAHTPLLGPDQWRRELTASGFGPVRTLGAPGTPAERGDQCVFVAEAATEAAATLTETSVALDGAYARAYVRGVFAEVLKFDPAALADDVTFENYGVDSLVSLRIINRFEEDLGELPATLLFEKLTIARLADHFLDAHGPALARLATPAPPRTETSPSAAPGPAHTTEPTTPAAARPTTTAGSPAGAAEPLSPAAARPSPAPAPPAPPAPAASGDIAVIGVSGRYPGAPGLDAFLGQPRLRHRVVHRGTGRTLGLAAHVRRPARHPPAHVQPLGRLPGRHRPLRPRLLRHPRPRRRAHRPPGTALPGDRLEPPGGERPPRQDHPGARHRRLRRGHVRHLRAARGHRLAGRTPLRRPLRALVDRQPGVVLLRLPGPQHLRGQRLLVLAHRRPPGLREPAARRVPHRRGRRREPDPPPRPPRVPERAQHALGRRHVQGVRRGSRRFRARRGRRRRPAQTAGARHRRRRPDLGGRQGRRHERGRQDRRLHRAQPQRAGRPGPPRPGGRRGGAKDGVVRGVPRHRHRARRPDRDRRARPGTRRLRPPGPLRGGLGQVRHRPPRRRGRDRGTDEAAAPVPPRPARALRRPRPPQPQDRFRRGGTGTGPVAHRLAPRARRRPPAGRGQLLRRGRRQRPPDP